MQLHCKIQRSEGRVGSQQAGAGSPNRNSWQVRRVFWEMDLRKYLLSALQWISLSVHVGSTGVPQAWEGWFGIPVLEMAAPSLQFEEVLYFCAAKLAGIPFFFFPLFKMFFFKHCFSGECKSMLVQNMLLIIKLQSLSRGLRVLIGHCCCVDGMCVKCGRS